MKKEVIEEEKIDNKMQILKSEQSEQNSSEKTQREYYLEELDNLS